jgi:HEAT repeat protein
MTSDSQHGNPADADGFLRLPEVNALVTAGVSAGLSKAAILRCLRGLRTIFDSLSFGEQPDFDALDRDALRQLPEIEFVVRAMAASPAADLRTAGYHVMGVLDSPSFVPDLREASTSPVEWERIEAARALARMSQQS